MAIVRMRKRNRSRTHGANETDHIHHLALVAVDAAIGPSQIRPPRRSEHRPRRLGLRFPLVGSSVRPQLTARQIAQTDPESQRRMERNRPTQANLEVVGMGTENEEVYWFRVLHFRSKAIGLSCFTVSFKVSGYRFRLRSGVKLVKPVDPKNLKRQIAASDRASNPPQRRI